MLRKRHRRHSPTPLLVFTGDKIDMIDIIILQFFVILEINTTDTTVDLTMFFHSSSKCGQKCDPK